jgi:hypothetical protein
MDAEVMEVQLYKYLLRHNPATMGPLPVISGNAAGVCSSSDECTYNDGSGSGRAVELNFAILEFDRAKQALCLVQRDSRVSVG